MFHSTEQNTKFKLLIRIVLISTLKSRSHLVRLFEWGFFYMSMILTGASLSQTKDKRYSDFLFCCIIFFQDCSQSKLKVPSNIISISNSLDLDEDQYFARSDQGL